MRTKQNNKTIKLQINNWWDCDANRMKVAEALTFVITAFGFIFLTGLSIVIAFYGLKLLSANLNIEEQLGGLNIYLMTAFSLGVSCTAFFIEGKKLAVDLFAHSFLQKTASSQKGE